MRRIFGLILAAGLIAAGGCSKKQAANVKDANALSGKITVSGAWALYPMTVKWSEEFRKIHPGVTIDISAGGAGKGMADALSKTVDLGMVSREINPVEIERGAWWVSVVKDAVVPTINSANPVAPTLLKRGMRQNEFASIWISGSTTKWNELVAENAQELPVHIYTRSDACGAAETWAKYLGGNQQDLKGIGVYGDPGLAEAVRKDNLGIGFNNITFAYDMKTGNPVDGLGIIPIDINGNGAIDTEEAFYGTMDQLIKAIGEGKYPSPPARDLHLVSAGKPGNRAITEFLKWILTDGQKHVAESGYINLSPEKIADELKKFE